MIYFITSLKNPTLELAFDCIHFESEILKTINPNYEFNPGEKIQISGFPDMNFTISPFLTSNVKSLVETSNGFNIQEATGDMYQYVFLKKTEVMSCSGIMACGKLLIRQQHSLAQSQ